MFRFEVLISDNWIKLESYKPDYEDDDKDETEKGFTNFLNYKCKYRGWKFKFLVEFQGKKKNKPNYV